MKGSRRVLLGAISNWLRFIVSAAISFLLVPLMTRSLGSDRYGLWTLASSFLGFLQSLDAGFGAGTVKWTAESRTAQDAPRRDELLSTSLAVHLVAAGIGSLAVIAISFFFSGMFGIPATLALEGKGLFLLLGIRITMVGIPSGFLRGLVFGSDRLVVLNVVQTVSSIAYGVAAYFLLTSGMGTVDLAIAGLILALLETAATFLVALRAMRASMPPIGIRLGKVTWRRFKEAFSYSGASFMIQITSAILMQSDLILLKFFAPLAVVAGYGVAERLGEYGLILVKQVVNALTPAIARLDPAKEPAKARFFLANASKYSGAIAMILAVASWMLGGKLLAAWAGPEYGTYGTVLGLLLASYLLISVQMPCASYLTLKGDHLWASRAMGISALINIAASVALAFPFGYIGIALGTLVASLTVDGIALPLRAFRSVGMNSGDLIRRVWLKLALPAAAEAIAIALTSLLIHPQTIMQIMFAGLIGTAAFLGVFVPFSLDASERQLFLGGRKGR